MRSVNVASLVRLLSYANRDREMPIGPQARVIPIPRSVITVLSASRLACGLVTFGSLGHLTPREYVQKWSVQAKEAATPQF